ncbi:MAG: hypothetical protein AAF481_13740 [Acidobacteriota bacterium]
MPDIYNPGSGEYPGWVSAAHLESAADHALENSLLRSGDREMLTSTLESAKSGECHPAVEIGRGSTSYLDLPTSIQKSDYVFIGTVTGSSPGFSFGNPMTLYRLETEEVLRGPLSVGRVHFVRSRQADFRFKGDRVCRETSALEGPFALSDRLLLIQNFLKVNPDDIVTPREPLGRLEEGQVVLLDSSEGVHLPKKFQIAHPEWEGRDSESFLGWLRNLTEDRP